MKSMKKILAFCAASSLAIAGVASVPAMADGEPTISAQDITAKAGDTISVVVEMANNPGIVAWQVGVEYDPEVLELGTFTPGVYAGATTGPQENIPFVFSWADGLSETDYTTDGVLGTVEFTVKEGVAPGSYNIGLVCPDEESVFNVDWDNVTFNYKGATLTVEEDSQEPEEDSSEPEEESSVPEEESSVPEEPVESEEEPVESEEESVPETVESTASETESTASTPAETTESAAGTSSAAAATSKASSTSTGNKGGSNPGTGVAASAAVFGAAAIGAFVVSKRRK